VLRPVIVLVAVCALAAPALGVGADKPRERIDPVDQRRAQASLFSTRQLGRLAQRDPLHIAALPIPLCRGYAPDRSDLTITGDAEAYYVVPGSALGLSVAVFRTGLERSAWWKRVLTPRYAGCLARFLAIHDRRTGWRARPLQARRLRVNRTANDNAGYRIVIRYTKRGRRLDVYRDVVFLGTTRSVGSLVVYGYGKPCVCAKTLATRLAAQMVTSGA
jgi:hypothetical protein